MDTILKSIDSEKPVFVRGAAACQLATFGSINHQQILTKPTIMKKISIVLLLAIFCSVAHAQVQRGFSFQGYARNENGAAYANQRITVQFSIYVKNASAEYTETHSPTTDEYGLFQLFVGSGTVVSGNFNNLNFGAKDYWLKVEVKNATSSYATTSDTQLAAVPYAKSADNGIPAGTILAFASNNVPAGYLICDGSSYNRDQYPNLFNAIGTTWGGSGSSFNVPDTRGLFLRGWDRGAGRDPDRATRTAIKTGGATGDNVGSEQGDELKFHGHAQSTTSNSGSHTHPNSADGTNRTTAGYPNPGVVQYSGVRTQIGTDNGQNEIDLVITQSLSIGNAGSHTHTVDINPNGGNEGRAKNVAVNYIIKF
jgi:microcystin-dependent protein